MPYYLLQLHFEAEGEEGKGGGVTLIYTGARCLPNPTQPIAISAVLSLSPPPQKLSTSSPAEAAAAAQIERKDREA